MKAKLRKITVDSKEYLYHLRINYYSPSRTNGLRLTIFLSQQKATPLIIDFLTADNYFLWQPLNVGITLPHLKTNTEVKVNLHEPKYIRELILLGLKNGWTGSNNLPIQNGLHYLSELGFDVNSILPENNH